MSVHYPPPLHPLHPPHPDLVLQSGARLHSSTILHHRCHMDMDHAPVPRSHAAVLPISLGCLWVAHPNNEERRLHGAAWGAPQQRGGALTEPSRGHGGGVFRCGGCGGSGGSGGRGRSGGNGGSEGSGGRCGSGGSGGSGGSVGLRSWSCCSPAPAHRCMLLAQAAACCCRRRRRWLQTQAAAGKWPGARCALG